MVVITVDRSSEAAEKLEKILSSPEFGIKKHTGLLDYIAGFLKSAALWLKGILDKLKVPEGSITRAENNSANNNFSVIQIVGAAVILLLIAVITYFILRNVRRSRKLMEKEDAELLSTLKDPDSVVRKAAELFEKGETRQALRFLYIAVLLKLNEMDIIRIDKSKTNKQYLYEVRASGFELLEELESFTSAFNDCWYGGKKLQDSSFGQWLEIYRSVENARKRSGGVHEASN